MLREGVDVVFVGVVLPDTLGVILEVVVVVVVVVVGAVTLLVGVGAVGRTLMLLLLFAVVDVVAAAAVLLVAFEPLLTAVPRLTPILFVAKMLSYFSLKLAGIAALDEEPVLAVVEDDLPPSSGRAPREPEGFVLVAPTLLL